MVAVTAMDVLACVLMVALVLAVLAFGLVMVAAAVAILRGPRLGTGRAERQAARRELLRRETLAEEAAAVGGFTD